MFNINLILTVILILLCLVVIFLLWYKNKNITEKWLDPIDVIYWINLEHSVERRKKMEKMFRDKVFSKLKKNNNIIRINATNGKSPDIVYNLDTQLTNRNNQYTLLEYACLLSHLNTIKAFSETGQQIALIMEDDATLEYKPYWKETISEIIQNAPSDWEVIMLMIIPDKSCINLFCNSTYIIPTQLCNFNKIDICASTGAYIINKKGANKIMNTYQNGKFILQTDLPHTADFYLHRIIKTYAYKYPYFTYPYSNDSNIHEEHLIYHMKSKQMVNKYLYEI